MGGLYLKRFLIPGLVLAVTLGSVLILPALYHAEHTFARESRALAAFHPQSGWTLDNANIVDALDSLPLTLPIRKVEWESRVLTVDLKVATPEVSVSEIYSNIAEILTFSFDGTSNVDQILLRLVAEDKWLGTRHLLLAADVRRTEWSPELKQALGEAEEGPLADDIKARFHLTETKLWRDRFDPQENG